MGKKFRHDPVYHDVEVLHRTGYWPKVDGEPRVPKWAAERAKAWQCSPASGTVLEDAMRFEIRRLRRELKRGPQYVVARLSGFKDKYHLLVRVPHEDGAYYKYAPFWGTMMILPQAQDALREATK